MAKPWGRYEIGFMNHPKFLALTGNAISLWWEGKTYCDNHLTDGLIPTEALKTFRFRGKKSVELLGRSCGNKPDGTLYAPLWEAHVVGFKMHDYLDHNDCHDKVRSRMGAAEERRDADRRRQAAWRAAEKDKRDAERQSSQVVTADVTRDVSRGRNVTVTPSTETETETPPIESPVTCHTDVPLDVWFIEFSAEYPEQRRRMDAMTSHAWFDAFADVEDRATHYRLLRDRLANHKASEQWAERNVIPSMTKWLLERRWVQTLPGSKRPTTNGPTVIEADETRRRYLAS